MSTLLEQMWAQDEDVGWLVRQIPYVRFLGVEAQVADGEVRTQLPFEEHIVGNHRLPAMHGGVVGAMLEITAVLQVVHQARCVRIPKTVDVSFDYLRSAGPRPTHGRAVVVRLGRRAANVRAEVWQDDPAKPVATARAHLLMQ